MGMVLTVLLGFGLFLLLGAVLGSFFTVQTA